MKTYAYGSTKFDSVEKFAIWWASDGISVGRIRYSFLDHEDKDIARKERRDVKERFRSIYGLDIMSDDDFKFFGLVMQQIPEYYCHAADRLCQYYINRITPFNLALQAVRLGAREKIAHQEREKKKQLAAELREVCNEMRKTSVHPMQKLDAKYQLSLESVRGGLFPWMTSDVEANYNNKIETLNCAKSSCDAKAKEIEKKSEELARKAAEWRKYVDAEYNAARVALKARVALYR